MQTNPKYFFYLIRTSEELINQYSDQITRLCLNKCINDYDEPALSNGQRLCISRCTFKFRDTIGFGDRVTSFLEYQVNKDVSREENLTN